MSCVYSTLQTNVYTGKVHELIFTKSLKVISTHYDQHTDDLKLSHLHMQMIAETKKCIYKKEEEEIIKSYH